MDVEKGRGTRLGRIVFGIVVPGWLLIVFLTAVVPPQKERNAFLVGSAAALWLAAVVFVDYLLEAFSLGGWVDDVLDRVDWLKLPMPLIAMLVLAVVAWRWW